MRFVIVIMVFFATIAPSISRDNGQWEGTDPQVRQWYRSLMRPPPYTNSPCCGTADAYWADEVHVDKDGRTIAVITDDRDDAPLGRPHVPVGTQIVVPNDRLKFDAGNPTGHAILFLSYSQDVFCYVQGGGT